MNELLYFLRLVILYGGYLPFGILPVYHDVVIAKIIKPLLSFTIIQNRISSTSSSYLRALLNVSRLIQTELCRHFSRNMHYPKQKKYSAFYFADSASINTFFTLGNFPFISFVMISIAFSILPTGR